MIKKLLFSLTLLLSLVLNGQEYKRENARMECIYANYPDKGLALKQLIKNFEKQLIESKILTDSSGASYRKIIQRMANDTFIPYEFFDEFGDNWS